MEYNNFLCLTRILSLLAMTIAACEPLLLDPSMKNYGKETGKPPTATSPMTRQETGKSVRPQRADAVRPMERTAQSGNQQPSSNSARTPMEPEPLEEPILPVPALSSEEPPSLSAPPKRASEGAYVRDDVRVAQRAAEEPAGLPVEKADNAVRIPLHDVFFGLDSVALNEEGQATLTTNANMVKGSRVKRVVIEGHCDERGTSSYNLVLGEKRAMVIQQYLSELGIDPADIETISYGKERPVCSEPTESCYRQNRRGHLWMEAFDVPGTLSRLSQ